MFLATVVVTAYLFLLSAAKGRKLVLTSDLIITVSGNSDTTRLNSALTRWFVTGVFHLNTTPDIMGGMVTRPVH